MDDSSNNGWVSPWSLLFSPIFCDCLHSSEDDVIAIHERYISNILNNVQSERERNFNRPNSSMLSVDIDSKQPKKITNQFPTFLYKYLTRYLISYLLCVSVTFTLMVVNEDNTHIKSNISSSFRVNTFKSLYLWIFSFFVHFLPFFYQFLCVYCTGVRKKYMTLNKPITDHHRLILVELKCSGKKNYLNCSIIVLLAANGKNPNKIYCLFTILLVREKQVTPLWLLKFSSIFQ